MKELFEEKKDLVLGYYSNESLRDFIKRRKSEAIDKVRRAKQEDLRHEKETIEKRMKNKTTFQHRLRRLCNDSYKGTADLRYYLYLYRIGQCVYRNILLYISDLEEC